MNRATPKDIARIWKQLWGSSTPEMVAKMTDQWGDNVLDWQQVKASIGKLPTVEMTGDFWQCPTCRKFNEGGYEDEEMLNVVCPHCDSCFFIEE